MMQRGNNCVLLQIDQMTSESLDGTVIEEDDIGALIYRESQLRKKEAVAAKKNERNSSASKHRATSTRRDAATIRGESSFATTDSRKLRASRARDPWQRRLRLPPKGGCNIICLTFPSTLLERGLNQPEIEKSRDIPCKGYGLAVALPVGLDSLVVGEELRKLVEKRKRHLPADVDEGIEPTKKAAKRRQRKRYECSADGCTNNVVKGGVCWRHGAKPKIKLCSNDGCTNQAKRGGVCMRHGAKVKLCSSAGCKNIVVRGGVCITHGAKMKLCRKEGCTNIIGKGGVCVKHGAKLKRCSSEGCTNIVVKGGVCVRHGAKRKQCSSSGCTNQVQQGGVCVRHGAKRKQCSSSGCTNRAQNRGVCIRHGAKPKVKLCSNEGCTNIVIKKECAGRMGQSTNDCISRKDVPISIKPK
ncbi:hypothetical protein QTG54_016640 [Skeletonema marinoi]|uniref:Uncharacterized protein n=1 Tax=Skeletonema marinoi TaxID=267567 RepID=A0AAD8XSG4_9STRA|nr:hypothetical protein QTG54_016640 [Skeletonema marinoi]